MKKISKLFGVVAAIAALASCQEKGITPDTPVVPEGMQKMTLAVSAEPDTKAIMDADGVGNLYWYGDEDIAVIFQGDATAYKFSASLSAKNSAAEFVGAVPEGYTKNEIAAVYYPYAGEDATSYSDQVPSVQKNSGSINSATGCYKIEFPLCWINYGFGADITLATPEFSAVLFVAKEYVKPVKVGNDYVVNIHLESKDDYEADYSVVMNGADEDLIFAINVPDGDVKNPTVLVNFREDLYFGEELSTKDFKTIDAGYRYKLCEPDYLTCRALEDECQLTFQDDNIEYRIIDEFGDIGEWETGSWGSAYLRYKNVRVQFRVAEGEERGAVDHMMHLSTDIAHTWSGSIMSLINLDMEPSAFEYLFEYCTGMRIAPKLPATKLADYCYSGLFNGCTNLTVAPELPATKLVDGCYAVMFGGCENLVNVRMMATEGFNSWSWDSFLYGITTEGTLTVKNSDAKAAIEAMNIVPESWTIEIAQ